MRPVLPVAEGLRIPPEMLRVATFRAPVRQLEGRLGRILAALAAACHDRDWSRAAVVVAVTGGDSSGVAGRLSLLSSSRSTDRPWT